MYDSMYIDSYIKRGEMDSLEYLVSKGHDRQQLIEARKAFESYERRADPEKIKKIQALLADEKRLGHNINFDIDSISPTPPVIDYAEGHIPNLGRFNLFEGVRKTKGGKDYIWENELAQAKHQLPVGTKFTPWAKNPKMLFVSGHKNRNQITKDKIW